MNKRLIGKRGILATLFAIGFAMSGAYAQWSLGPRAGVNIGLISSNQPIDNLINIGFGGGLTWRYQFQSEKWNQLSIQGDALFNLQGAASKTRIENNGVLVSELEIVNVRSAVQVPVYVNFEVPFNRKRLVPYHMKTSFLSWHLYGGAAFNYTLGMAQTTKTTIYNSGGGVESVTSTPSADVDGSLYNPVDVGILFGTGFSFRLDKDNRQRLFLDARYVMGLLNQSKAADTEEKWSSAQIQVCYTRVLGERRYRRP